MAIGHVLLVPGAGGGGVAATYQLATIFGSDLKAAYSAMFSDMYVENTGPGGTPVSDGSAIGWIEDLSGNSHHIIQATVSKKPTYDAENATVNDQPALVLDGGDCMAASFGETYTQPVTIFAIGQSNEIGEELRRLYSGVETTNRLVFQQQNVEWRIYGGGLLVDGEFDTNVHSFVGVFNGASSSLYVDGSTAGASGNVGSKSLAGITLGASSNQTAAFWDGLNSELAIVNRIATASEINQVLAQWETDYGVSYAPVA